MINGKDFWCFTVIGQPPTKKRARTQGAIHFTFDNWYEKMVADAFSRLYPGFKPIGNEFYNSYVRTSKNGYSQTIYKLKKEYSKKDLPKLRIFMNVYTINNSGDDDNYVKTILDALNKVLYVDDYQVCVPTPRIIELEEGIPKIEVLAVKYFQNKDNALIKLQDFFKNNSFVIDIYNEYEDLKLLEHTKDWLYNHLCRPAGCPLFHSCSKYKKEIIQCEYRDSIKDEDRLVSINCNKRSCLCKKCNNFECCGKCDNCEREHNLTPIKECIDFR